MSELERDGVGWPLRPKRNPRNEKHVATSNMRHAILMADRNLNISETVRARKV